jgi:hypothetical protein
VKYDLFISHASEDKSEVALPLAEELRRLNFRVWLDKFELTVGDSLRESIDTGLASSRYGVVILSETFFAKKWPKRELNALYARTTEGNKVILPVWHNVDRERVAALSPSLADLLAANTNDGIAEVAASISRAISDKKEHSTPLTERQPASEYTADLNYVGEDTEKPNDGRGQKALAWRRAWIYITLVLVSILIIGVLIDTLILTEAPSRLSGDSSGKAGHGFAKSYSTRSNNPKRLDPPGTVKIGPSSDHERILAQLRRNNPEKFRSKGALNLWPIGATLRIRFMGGDASLHEMVKSVSAAWFKHANLNPVYLTSGESEIRIAFQEGAGSWSAPGTEALAIPQDSATMNFGHLSIVDEPATRTVLLHVFGIALGLIEEIKHPMSPVIWNKSQVYEDLSGPPNFWSKAEVDYVLLDKYQPSDIPDYRKFDPDSIMMPVNLRASWIREGLKIKPILPELSPSDKELISWLYPKIE